MGREGLSCLQELAGDVASDQDLQVGVAAFSQYYRGTRALMTAEDQDTGEPGLGVMLPGVLGEGETGQQGPASRISGRRGTKVDP